MFQAVGTDRTVLQRSAYGSDSDLRVRRETHARYSERQDDFHDWVIAHLPYRPAEALLDVGCGPGDFLPRLRKLGHHGVLAGCDLSVGMIDQAQRDAPSLAWSVADVQALPFGDARFQGVLARHMLYHVPDIHRGIVELARVTAAGGWVAITTNSRNSQYLLGRIWREIDHPKIREPEAPSRRFPLEDAPSALEPYFERITVHERDDALCFPAAEPVKRYLASMRHLKLAPAHTDQEWSMIREVLFGVVDRVWAEQAEAGQLRVPKRSGLILAHSPR